MQAHFAPRPSSAAALQTSPPGWLADAAAASSAANTNERPPKRRCQTAPAQARDSAPAASHKGKASASGSSLHRLQTQFRAAQKNTASASAGAGEEPATLLLQYASGLAQQRIAALASSSSMRVQTINTWLEGMCKQRNGKKDPPELAACKKVVLAACLQLMVRDGRAEDAKAIMEKRPPIAAGELLVKLPGEMENLRTARRITGKNWIAINQKSRGYNLLALIGLSAELAAYESTALVNCARKTPTCQELVALTNEAVNRSLPFDGADRVRIASNGGGWKNLEAASRYMSALPARRAVLETNLQAQGQPLTPEQIDHALVPFTIAIKDMVRILSHDGGSKNLEATTAYLEELRSQRATLEGNLQALGITFTPEQIDHALAPFTIPMKELVRIVSQQGGSQRLQKRLQEIRHL